MNENILLNSVNVYYKYFPRASSLNNVNTCCYDSRTLSKCSQIHIRKYTLLHLISAIVGNLLYCHKLVQYA